MTDTELITKAASVVLRHSKMEKRAQEVPIWMADDEGDYSSKPVEPKTYYPGGVGAPEFKNPTNMFTGLARTAWGANKAYNPLIQVPMAMFHNSDPRRPSGAGGMFRNFLNSAATGFSDPTANRLAKESIPGYTAFNALRSGQGWRDALKTEYNSSNPIWSALRANRAYGQADMTHTMPAWSKDPKSVLNQMRTQGVQGAKLVDQQGPAVY